MINAQTVTLHKHSLSNIALLFNLTADTVVC